MHSRAIHEIQTEAHRLAVVNVTSAADACDWVALDRLADRLKELAARGLYHAANEKAKSMAAFAMGNHREADPR